MGCDYEPSQAEIDRDAQRRKDREELHEGLGFVLQGMPDGMATCGQCAALVYVAGDRYHQPYNLNYAQQHMNSHVSTVKAMLMAAQLYAPSSGEPA